MLKKEVRIVYLGTPEISARVLERLLDNQYNIVSVIAQEDKPTGRGNKLEEVPTKKVAKKYNIPCFQFSKIREHYEEIKAMKPDVLLTMAYGQLISDEILDLAKYGPLNLHGSLLPKYRGAAPIQFAILNGEKESGVTLMKMVKKMDAGTMYAKETFAIDEFDNYDSVCGKIIEAAFNVLNKNLDNYLNGNLIGEEQNEEEATFTKKILPEDEVIDFYKDAKEIVSKIKALSSKPGAYFIYKNEKIKILMAKFVDVIAKPGTILKYDKNSFLIAAENGSIEVLNIQKQGKKAMNYKDFYNGNAKLFEVNSNLNNE